MCPNCFCCRCKCGSKKKKAPEKDKPGEDTIMNDQPYRYLTVDEMKSLGDDSLPIDVTRDERTEAQVLSAPPTADHDSISPLHASYTLNLTNVAAPDNVDIGRNPLSFGFLVSFLVDARGGAMRGCRHSGVRLIVPPRRAAAPTRVTCRYLRKDKLSHPPPLMEGEALASRILELGPVGAKFLGPVMIEVPHFASLRGSEREIVILRSDNGETWREHTVEASDEVVQEILSHSFDKEDMPPPVETDPTRMTRILTLDFPHYFAVVSRVKQEVHAIGPEGGMVSSSVVPQVQAVFPQGALTKKIKVGLQAQPIPTDITAKLLGNRVAVSPIVTIEPRRRKFHKPITLTIPVPQAANKGMINQYSGDAPTLRLLCSITGGIARAQWEDVTGTTPLTFVNDCVSFTTTVSARFWLMDCRNVQDSAKMATELYREAIHVPFMAKFVVFAKRVEQLEARLRVFCMTDDKEDKTLEHQEHFTEVAKSRDVEVLEGKSQFIEFAGNLVPVTKSGDQLRLGFRAFRENRLPFTVRVKDPHADVIGRTLFMKEPKVSKGDAPQQPICVLNIVLPGDIIPETILPDAELTRYQYLQDSRGLESYQRSELRLSDISNHLENDWIPLATSLGVSNSDISRIQTEYPESEAQQAMSMLRLWMKQSSNKATAATLESALVNIGRQDIIRQCIYTEPDHDTSEPLTDRSETLKSQTSTFRTTDLSGKPQSYGASTKDRSFDSEPMDHVDDEVVTSEAEPNVIEEPNKSVSERKREIEKRLSQERSLSQERYDKKLAEEPKVKSMVTESQVTTISETDFKKEDEPELTFQDKRLSFERASSQDRAKTDAFIQAERKISVQTEPTVVEDKVDEAAKLSFKEKRKSFEHGSVDKPDLKDDKKYKPDDAKKLDEKLSGTGQPEKIVTERKVVSETISKTVETVGDKKSIISEKVTKTTEIKGDDKPVTTEVVTTTIETPGVEKPVVSKTTTKIIEETETVKVSGAKTVVDPTGPVISETVTKVKDKSPDDKKTAEDITMAKVSTKVEIKPLEKPEVEEIFTKTSVEEIKDRVAKEKSPGATKDGIVKDIRTTESRVISETITTKKIENTVDGTTTVTEITTKTSDSGELGEPKVVTEVFSTSDVKTDKQPGTEMSLEERRNSELFEGVTQGLLSTVKSQETKPKDILSPKLISTPPPSPADLKDAIASPPTESWTSSATTTDKTAIFIDTERGAKPADKPIQDSNVESQVPVTTKLDEKIEPNGSDSDKSVTELDQESPENDPDVSTTKQDNNDEKKGGKRKRKKNKGKNKQNHNDKNKDHVEEKATEIQTEIYSEIDISTDEVPMIVSENITVKENIVEKKDKKKNKKNKKDSKAISQEILNATNLATSMILLDPAKMQMGEPKISNSSISSVDIENQKPTEDEHDKPSDVENKMVVEELQSKIPPFITEVVPKQSISSNKPSLDVIETPVGKKSPSVHRVTFQLYDSNDKENQDLAHLDSEQLDDVFTKSIESIIVDEKFSSLVNEPKTQLNELIEENEIIHAIVKDASDKVKNEKIQLDVEDNIFPVLSGTHSDLNPTIVNVESFNPFSKDIESNNSGPNDSPYRGVNPFDLVSDICVSNDNLKVGEDLACISSERISAEVPDNISGAVKILSEFNSSELPDAPFGKVTCQKITSEIPDVINGNSKVIVEKITTEIPDELTGVSKVITKKITTEIPDQISGISTIVTETFTTESISDPKPVDQSVTTKEENIGQLPIEASISKTSLEMETTKQNEKEELHSPENLNTFSMGAKRGISPRRVRSAAEEEELTNEEEVKEIIAEDKFNDIIKNLSNSSREDIEQLLAGTLSQDPQTQDEKLTNLLIDMLIEQETMKLAASGDLPADIESDGSDLEETNHTSTLSENSVIENKSKTSSSNDYEDAEQKRDDKIGRGKTVDTIRSMVKENSEPVFSKFKGFCENDSETVDDSSPRPYVTTPTLTRRGIGGSQRYSREERPMLIEVSKRYVSSSDEEEAANETSENYVVTEPSPVINKRKVTFRFDESTDLDGKSSDEGNDKEEEERVHFELVDEVKEEIKPRDIPIPSRVKLSRSPSTDSTSSKRNSIEIPKLDDLNQLKKVERKFERMASETLEDTSLAKGAVEGEFQRLMSQLSTEEVDECLMVWTESELIPIGEEGEAKSEEWEAEQYNLQKEGESEDHGGASTSQGSRKKEEKQPSDVEPEHKK